MVGIHPAYNILIFFFFPAEDEAAAARISAKSGLESYAYNLCNSRQIWARRQVEVGNYCQSDITTTSSYSNSHLIPVPVCILVEIALFLPSSFLGPLLNATVLKLAYFLLICALIVYYA